MTDRHQDRTAGDLKRAAEDSQTVDLNSMGELLKRSDIQDKGVPNGSTAMPKRSQSDNDVFSEKSETSSSERASDSDVRTPSGAFDSMPPMSRKAREQGEELDCRMTNKLMIDDFTEPQDTETVEQRRKRKGQIERNLHNQRTYYEQRNNFESDEASDIQSEIDSTGERAYTYDDKMRALVKMFIQSFVPFHLIHGSYFQNLLRNSFGIRKMPKLVEFQNFFQTIHELGTKYITQTLGGAKSYTLIFEFWKTTNRRHQYLTIRGSYIDVFVRR